MQIRFLKPVKPDGRKLNITSAVRHSSRMVRVAEAEVFDANGRRVALATGSATVIPGGIEMLKQGSRCSSRASGPRKSCMSKKVNSPGKPGNAELIDTMKDLPEEPLTNPQSDWKHLSEELQRQ